MKSALSPPILPRGVWAGHPKDNPVGEEEHAGRGMIKFAATVALNRLDGGVELRVHIREKMSEDAKSVRLEA
jgi:hypothetical protein